MNSHSTSFRTTPTFILLHFRQALRAPKSWVVLSLACLVLSGLEFLPIRLGATESFHHENFRSTLVLSEVLFLAVIAFPCFDRDNNLGRIRDVGAWLKDDVGFLVGRWGSLLGLNILLFVVISLWASVLQPRGPGSWFLGLQSLHHLSIGLWLLGVAAFIGPLLPRLALPTVLISAYVFLPSALSQIPSDAFYREYLESFFLPSNGILEGGLKFCGSLLASLGLSFLAPNLAIGQSRIRPLA